MAETETTVVHVNDPDGFDQYIGRGMWRPKDPRCRERSVYANPYRIKQNGRAGSLRQYEQLWRHRLAGPKRRFWQALLEALRDKRLACWCKPKPCHGDVLVKLLNELATGGST